jgi:hypothetical protein
MSDSIPHTPEEETRASADESLVAALRAADFQGLAWERFAEQLARYALPIITTWICTLRMFRECAVKGVRCPSFRPDERLPREAGAEMANEIISRALVRFRDLVLRPGLWSPQGGASLKSSFITQCLYQFPNVYRGWLRENKQLPADDLAELELLETPDGDPAGLVMVRDEIVHALEHYVKDERVRRGLFLRAWEYTTKESAEMIGVTEKALDSAFQRHWKGLRNRSDGVGERKLTP